MGHTMGTTYSIYMINHQICKQVNGSAINKYLKIDLLKHNYSMSTYINNSSISILNKLQTENHFCLKNDFQSIFLRTTRKEDTEKYSFNNNINFFINSWGF